jgi:hypothetical protein
VVSKAKSNIESNKLLHITEGKTNVLMKELWEALEYRII